MDDLSRTYCVIGDPIDHSLSPIIHRLIYKVLDLKLHYEAVRVKRDDLKDFINGTKKFWRPGFNVTIPHKERIIDLLDELDPLAKEIGAVNTVRNSNGLLKGYNTDVEGFEYALRRVEWNRNGDVVILGAGGAARAAVYALISKVKGKLFVFNRTPQRAENLARDFSNRGSIEACSMDHDMLARTLFNSTLLVNATPIGMWPDVDSSPLPSAEMISQDMVVFDMIPNPVFTRLLKQAESKGARVVSGLSMLIFQALGAERIWIGITFPHDIYDRIWNLVVESTNG